MEVLKLYIVQFIFRSLYLFTYLLTYLLTPWSRVLLVKVTGSQIVNKFPAFYDTRRFLTAFTRARHLSLSWIISVRSVPPHPTSWSSVLIPSSYLRHCLPSSLFSSRLPTKTLYTPFFSMFHRAFFNSVMDKTPTHALFIQHYISLACWFH